MIERILELASAGWALEARRRGVRLGVSPRFRGRPIVSREPGSLMQIGARFSGLSASRYQVLGVAHPCVLRTVRSGAHLSIGNDCGMSGGSIVCALRIEIGDGVLLGANVTIFDTNFHPVHVGARHSAPMPEPRARDRVMIGSNVFLGTGSIVLPGTTIEDDSVIGAGAVVRGTIPAGSIVAGQIARIIGSVQRP